MTDNRRSLKFTDGHPCYVHSYLKEACERPDQKIVRSTLYQNTVWIKRLTEGLTCAAPDALGPRTRAGGFPRGAGTVTPRGAGERKRWADEA